jgi:hypothetical protein
MQTWLLMMWSLVRLAVRRTAPLTVLVGVCAGNVCIARADIQPTEPFYVAVTGPQAELRCREGDISYVVATLKAGTVLVGDGKGEGWIRVQYPAGLYAVVKANEVTYDAARKKVTLTTPSRLRAMELAGGPRSHWWHLLDENLPAGESFDVVEVLKRSEGEVEAYKIIAPAGAHGFLRADAVREATADEIARLGGSGGVQPAHAAASTPARATTPAQPAGAPQDAQAAAPTSGDPASAPLAAAPATTAAVTTPEPMDGPEARLMDRVDALASIFNDVQKQPVREAEVEPVIAEFEQAIASLGDGEVDQVLKGFLESRLQLLKLRKDIRTQLLAIHTSTEALDAEAQRVEELVDALSNAGRYAVVGRLTPSSVYDGRRLPLMYRIESADSGISRTIAYLEPKAQQDYAPMFGRIVGVVGTIETDADRNIRIVRPTTVDLIKEANPAPAPIADPAPEANAEPASGAAPVGQGGE